MSSDAADEGVHALEMRFMWIWFAEPGDKNRTYGLVMELVDLPDSKSGAKACGFESHLGHQEVRSNPRRGHCGRQNFKTPLSSLCGDRKLKEERPGVTGCKHTPALYAFVMELVDIPD